MTDSVQVEEHQDTIYLEYNIRDGEKSLGTDITTYFGSRLCYNFF